jgi:hypothetical protein
MATTLREVVQFINSSMSPADREVIIKTLNSQRKLADMKATMDLYPGVTVEWNSHRMGGQTVTGTVKKVNRTTVHVQQENPHVMWRVSPTLLRVVPR